MLKRILLLALCSVIPAMMFVYAQDTTPEDKDKFTVQNFMLETITECRYGMIIEFIYEQDLKRMYIPNQFFIDGRAVKIVENDSRVSPQMNVVYKNKTPFKIKLYLAKNASSLTYRFLEKVPESLAEQFKINDLTINL